MHGLCGVCFHLSVLNVVSLGMHFCDNTIISTFKVSIRMIFVLARAIFSVSTSSPSQAPAALPQMGISSLHRQDLQIVWQRCRYPSQQKQQFVPSSRVMGFPGVTGTTQEYPTSTSDAGIRFSIHYNRRKLAKLNPLVAITKSGSSSQRTKCDLQLSKRKEIRAA